MNILHTSFSRHNFVPYVKRSLCCSSGASQVIKRWAAPVRKAAYELILYFYFLTSVKSQNKILSKLGHPDRSVVYKSDNAIHIVKMSSIVMRHFYNIAHLYDWSITGLNCKLQEAAGTLVKKKARASCSRDPSCSSVGLSMPWVAHVSTAWIRESVKWHFETRMLDSPAKINTFFFWWTRTNTRSPYPLPDKPLVKNQLVK